MGVISNLGKLKFCKRIGLIALRYSTEPKPQHINSKICNYVMQKQDLSQVLKKESELQAVFKTKKKMSAVDLDLCVKVSSCDFNDVLVLLNSFVAFDYEYCMNSLFYKVFLENLKKGVLEQAKWDQLIQVVYYVAHHGTSEESKRLIIKCLNCLDDRSEVSDAEYRDICVVSEAAFKTDTVIASPKILNRMKEVCKKDFYNLSADPIWLGMLFKGFRMAGTHDFEFLLEITDILKKSELTENFDLMTAKQLINYYSDTLVKDEVLLDTFIRSSAKYIRKWMRADKNKAVGTNGERVRPPRMKDLGRFLYSLVTLDHLIDSRLLESVFVPCFLKLQTKTFNQHELNPSYARNCLISFWYMGYDLERIGDVCKSAAENIENEQVNQRNVNLAFKLLVIIALQYPELLTKKLKDIKTLLAQQNAEVTKVPVYNEGSLKFLKNLISRHKDDFKISKIAIENPIEPSSIQGLSILANGETIHIDVMEKEFCLALTETPNGNMGYKIRLLPYVPKINRHIIMHRNELLKLKDFNDTEVYDYLKSTIFETRRTRRQLLS